MIMTNLGPDDLLLPFIIFVVYDPLIYFNKWLNTMITIATVELYLFYKYSTTESLFL